MTDRKKLIRGAGGPPPPPKPYRAPDTLHSRQFATVQDLISVMPVPVQYLQKH